MNNEKTNKISVYFYNPATNGFLVEGLHTIPNHAIEVSESDFHRLTEAREQGAAIMIKNGEVISTPPRPTPFHTWNGTEWAISPEQQAVKKAEEIAKVRAEINALRDRKTNGGVYVEAVGKWIDSDATAERNILSVKGSFDLFGKAVGEIAWSCADNSILMINKTKLMAIWQALMTTKTANHANALKHKAAVEQAENPLEYDYSGGWSKSYEDYIKEQQNG